MTEEYITEEQASELQRMYLSVFDSEAGRDVLANLSDICGIELPLYVGGDVNIFLVNEGKRQAYLHIKNMCELKPKQIAFLLNQSRG